MYQIKEVPLTISGILKDSWKLYKNTLFYLLPWSFILSLVHVIPYFFGLIGFYQYSHGHLSFSWRGLFIYVALLIVESFFVAVIIYSLQLLATQQKLNYSEVFNLARKRFLNLYFALIIYFLAVNVGMILLVIPGIFLATILSMFLPFIILEGQDIYDAFVNSFKLVWGAWWQTFLVFLVPLMLSYLARSIIKYTPWVGGDWLHLVDIVVLMLMAPYFYSALLIQFHNLKYIKSLPKSVSDRPRVQS